MNVDGIFVLLNIFLINRCGFLKVLVLMKFCFFNVFWKNLKDIFVFDFLVYYFFCGIDDGYYLVFFSVWNMERVENFI